MSQSNRSTKALVVAGSLFLAGAYVAYSAGWLGTSSAMAESPPQSSATQPATTRPAPREMMSGSKSLVITPNDPLASTQPATRPSTQPQTLLPGSKAAPMRKR